MINSVSQTPSFGHRCSVTLPASTDLETLYKKVDVKNRFDLKFLRPGSGKVKLDANEFVYNGKSNIKDTNMAEFVFDDRQKGYNYKLPAFLKSVFGDSKVTNM